MESFNPCARVPSQLISEKVIAINTAAKNVLVYKSSNGCYFHNKDCTECSWIWAEVAAEQLLWVGSFHS